MFPRLGTLLRWILCISSWIPRLQELGVDVVVVGLADSWWRRPNHRYFCMSRRLRLSLSIHRHIKSFTDLWYACFLWSSQTSSIALYALLSVERTSRKRQTIIVKCWVTCYISKIRCITPEVLQFTWNEQIVLHAKCFYHVSPKNCTILFLQYLWQSKLYFDNFWHTYTLVNLLSQAYFIFFINSKAENQLKFQ